MLSTRGRASRGRREIAAWLSTMLVLLLACSCASLAHAQEPSPPQKAQLSVLLSIDDPQPFEPGRALRLVAHTEPAGSKLEYHFYFGDGSTSGWVRESQVRHTYANTGAFYAVVFVREPVVEGAPVRPSIRSNRLTITVAPQMEQPKPQQQGVRLEITPLQVRVGDPVQARAYLDPAMERVEYRFDFGDGQPVEVRPEALMEYRYTTPGVYEAFVQVRQGDRQVAESDRVRIAVVSVPAHRLLLEVDRRNPQAGQAVRFSWRIEPHAPDVLYLIDFGDGNQSPQGAYSPVDHVYAEAREYRALLRARIGAEEVISNEVLVTVSPVDRDSLYMLGAIIAAALGMVLLALGIIRRIRKRRGTKEPPAPDTQALSDAGISVNACRDPGFQSLEFGSPAKPLYEVRLNPVSDRGRQMMDQGTAVRMKKEVSHE